MADEDLSDAEYKTTDHIADRTMAFAHLALQLGTVKDKEIKSEGVLMLRAVRLSFKLARQGEVAVVTRLGQRVANGNGLD